MASKHPKFDLIVFGESTIDQIYQVAEFPSLNNKTGRITACGKPTPGGRGPNVAAYSSLFNIKPALLSAHSKDYLGILWDNVLTESLRSAPLVLKLPKDTDANPQAIIFRDAQQRSQTFFFPGFLSSQREDYKEIAKAFYEHVECKAAEISTRALYLTSEIFESTNRILAAATEKNISLKAFAPGPEISLCDESQLTEILRQCNCLFLNQAEAAVFERKLNNSITRLISGNETNLQFAVVTLGANGALFFSKAMHPGAATDMRRRAQFFPSYTLPPNSIVDTTGCGDAFCGAFLGYLLESVQENFKLQEVDIGILEKAVMHGIVVSSFVAQCAGTLHEDLDRAKVDARYEEYSKQFGQT